MGAGGGGSFISSQFSLSPDLRVRQLWGKHRIANQLRGRGRKKNLISRPPSQAPCQSLGRCVNASPSPRTPRNTEHVRGLWGGRWSTKTSTQTELLTVRTVNTLIGAKVLKAKPGSVQGLSQPGSCHWATVSHSSLRKKTQSEALNWLNLLCFLLLIIGHLFSFLFYSFWLLKCSFYIILC